MFKKTMVCATLAAALLVQPVCAQAAGRDPATPSISVMSSNVTSSGAGLSISSSGKAGVSANVSAKLGTSKIEAVVKLQKYNKSTGSWEKAKKWEETVNSFLYSADKSYSLSSHGTYRVKLTAKVWNGGVAETVTEISAQKVY